LFYIQTNIKHANGLLEYNTRNIFGTMMSVVTRETLLARRPGKRTFVITRSTFVGAGAHVGKWLDDNPVFGTTIGSRFLACLDLRQVPMVGSDICGFGMFSFVEYVGRVLSFYA
jgi:alpha-glucosidase